MPKNKATVLAMAIISFIIMPYACDKGITKLYETWETVEAIKINMMSNLPSSVSKYIADISIDTIQQGLNWFVVGIRGFGYGTMVYCISGRDYRYGFIIAALADGMNILNRIRYGYGFSFERIDLIFLGIPFAMCLCCMAIGSLIKGKGKVLFVAITAVLAYWGIYTYLNGQIYFNVNFVILSSMIILSSSAMNQMDL